MVTRDILGNTFCSLRIRPMVLLTVLNTFRRCSSNVSFKTKVTPKCFCELVWDIIDPCRTPALTLVQVDTWPLRTTLCFLLLKKSVKMFNKSPEMPFCFSLEITPSCQTLSKALDMSKKTLLTSSLAHRRKIYKFRELLITVDWCRNYQVWTWTGSLKSI